MIGDMQSLLQIKQVIDGLKGIASDTGLTETEQRAVNDCLSQAYDRAAFLLENTKASLSFVSWYYLCRRCHAMIPVTFEEYALRYREKRGQWEHMGGSAHLARCIPCEIIVVLHLDRKWALGHFPEQRASLFWWRKERLTP